MFIYHFIIQYISDLLVCSSRDTMSKLEQLFEQETLKERDNYDEGADDSTTELALAKLKSAKEKPPEVSNNICIQYMYKI